MSGLKRQLLVIWASTEVCLTRSTSSRNVGSPPTVAAHDRRVDETSDDILELTAGAVGNRRPDEQVVLAAAAVQQHLEHGEKRHKRRHVLTTTERPEPFAVS